MARGTIVPVDVFVREWVKAAAQGQSAKDLAKTLGQKPESVSKRGSMLRKDGIDLPNLHTEIADKVSSTELAKRALAQAMEEFFNG